MLKVQTTYGEIDLSDFSLSDVANLALQRTATLINTGIPRITAPSYVFWARWGNYLPLRLEARLRSRRIVTRAIEMIAAEVAELEAYLDRQSIRTVCDIGCGYALHDLLLSRVFDLTRIHLIDIEESREHHHDFHPVGAGYSNLARAAELVKRNAPGSLNLLVTTHNPNRSAVEPDQQFDLIMSLLSCGFHYPVETYVPFFEAYAVPEGRLVLDLLRGEDHSALFSAFEIETTISSLERSERVLLRRR